MNRVQSCMGRSYISSHYFIFCRPFDKDVASVIRLHVVAFVP